MGTGELNTQYDPTQGIILYPKDMPCPDNLERQWYGFGASDLRLFKNFIIILLLANFSYQH